MAQVLEAMFFVSPCASPRIDPEDNPIVVSLCFEGSPGGSLRVQVAPRAALAMAVDFLAADESGLTRRQVEDVMCEMTNMICGATLSRLESEQAFCLDAPRIVTPGDAPIIPDAVEESVDIGSGVITATLVISSAPCLCNEKSAS